MQRFTVSLRSAENIRIWLRESLTYLRLDNYSILISLLGMQNRDTTVTADEISHFFAQVGSKLRTLQNKINQNAKERHDQENVMRDLRYNIRGLKTDLQTAHDNLLNSENIKSSLDDQYDRLNATFKIQVRQKNSSHPFSICKINWKNIRSQG